MVSIALARLSRRPFIAVTSAAVADAAKVNFNVCNWLASLSQQISMAGPWPPRAPELSR